MLERFKVPQKDQVLMESYYAQTRTVGSDFLWPLRGLAALFTRRAWVPEEAAAASNDTPIGASHPTGSSRSRGPSSESKQEGNPQDKVERELANQA